jgi:hypothetical protein
MNGPSISGRPFKPTLMFVSKAGAFPSGVTFKCLTLRQITGIPHKHYTLLEKFGRNKHFSLLGQFVTYEEKKVL